MQEKRNMWKQEGGRKEGWDMEKACHCACQLSRSDLKMSASMFCFCFLSNLISLSALDARDEEGRKGRTGKRRASVPASSLGLMPGQILRLD